MNKEKHIKEIVELLNNLDPVTVQAIYEVVKDLQREPEKKDFYHFIKELF